MDKTKLGRITNEGQPIGRLQLVDQIEGGGNLYLKKPKART